MASADNTSGAPPEGHIFIGPVSPENGAEKLAARFAICLMRAQTMRNKDGGHVTQAIGPLRNTLRIEITDNPDYKEGAPE
jgi:hypothetical protein